MNTIEVHSSDGTRLALHDLGGAGDPLVFVHGAGLHGHVFAPVAKALRPHFRCFALDLRGHGSSGVSADLDFEWARLSEDVAAAVASIGGPPPFGVVHSAGGNAALRAEALAPGTFSSLFCYEPVMRTPSEVDENHPLIVQALRRKAHFTSREEAFARFRPRPPFDTVTDEALWAYVDYGFLDDPNGGITLACRPEYEAAVYLAGRRADLYDVAPRIACPVTVAAGITPTNPLGPAFARACVERIDTATLLEFEGLGHLGPFEDPLRVAGAIITASATAPA